MSSEQSADQIDDSLSGLDTWEIVSETSDVIDEIDLVSSDEEDSEDIEEVTALESAHSAFQLNQDEQEMGEMIRYTKDNNVAVNFEDMNLSKELLHRVFAAGLRKPTPLQQKAIIPCLKGHDVIMHAPQKAGKKTAVALSVLQVVDISLPHCQVLMLFSSRSKAKNMIKILCDLGYYENFKWNPCSDDKQTHALEMGVPIVIGTVPTVRKLICNNQLRTDCIRIVCFEYSFHFPPNVPYGPSIYSVLKLLKPDVQVIITSRKPVSKLVIANKEEIILENIELIYQPSNFKFQDIFQHHSRMNATQCAVFYNKSLSTGAIVKKAKIDDISVSSLLQGKDEVEGRITRERNSFSDHTVNSSIMSIDFTKNRVSAMHDCDYPPIPGIHKSKSSCSEKRKVDVKEHQILHDVSDFTFMSVADFLKSHDNRLDSNHSARRENEQDYSLNGIHDGTIDTFGHDVTNNFSMMNLPEELLVGIYTCGLEKPTPLQQKAIMHCIHDYDVVIQGFPRTGKKTAAAVAALQHSCSDLKCCQVLMLTSNNQTAQYLWKLLVQLGHYMEVQCHSLNHGNPFSEDHFKQQMTSHIIVGTPVQVCDVIDRKVLCIDHITLLVLDEAHVMVSTIAKEATYAILNTLNSGARKIFLSSFMPTKKWEIFGSFLKNPVCLLPVTQFFIPVANDYLKIDAICKIYKVFNITKAMIFCNSKHRVNCLTTGMLNRGFKVSAVHSGILQAQRSLILKEFSTLCDHTLITTSFTCDSVQDVAVIINYDIAILRQNYMHQITRCPEAITLSFVCEHESKLLQKIESLNRTNSVISRVCVEL